MLERRALSLRWRLLLGLMLPLAVLMGVNAWLGYDRAVQAANEAYDRSLYLAARTLAEDLQWQDGRVELLMRPGTGYLFEKHIGSRLFYRISGDDAHPLLGAEDLPRPDLPQAPPQVHYFALVQFADAHYQSQPVRLAQLTHVLQTPGAGRMLYITVAETREAREALIRTILRETLGSQALLLVAVVLSLAF